VRGSVHVHAAAAAITTAVAAWQHQCQEPGGQVSKCERECEPWDHGRAGKHKHKCKSKGGGAVHRNQEAGECKTTAAAAVAMTMNEHEVSMGRCKRGRGSSATCPLSTPPPLPHPLLCSHLTTSFFSLYYLNIFHIFMYI
jgi:hypothetical protein